MADYLTTDTELTSVANAIRTKGGTSAALVYPAGFVSAIEAIPTGIAPTGTISITENGTVDVTQYATADVNVSGGGGNPTADENDVIFIDYDGTIRYSYTAANFANLTAMPENPTHDGLTAQGWNWSLSDAKTFVATHKQLIIGQLYDTDDTKSRLYIYIAGDIYNSPKFYWYQSGDMVINFGDGTVESFTGVGNKNTTHTYSQPGLYIVSFDVANNEVMRFGFSDNGYNVFGETGTSNAYNGILKKVELGSRIQFGGALNYYSFYGCYALETITIPNHINNLGQRTFYNCYSLKSITIPSTVTSFYDYVLYNAYTLKKVSLPKGININANYFVYNNYALDRFIIPDGCVSLGNYNLCNAYCIKTIIVPSTVTRIGSNFASSAKSLQYVYMYSSTPPSIGSFLFSSASSNYVISVPAGSKTTYDAASNWSNVASHIVERSA